MMRREKFAIANIYVPIKRRATLKPESVQEIAQSMLKSDSKHPSKFGAMVIVSSSYTGCIASKRARHWAKRRSMDTSSRPRSTNRYHSPPRQSCAAFAGIDLHSQQAL